MVTNFVKSSQMLDKQVFEDATSVDAVVRSALLIAIVIIPILVDFSATFDVRVFEV